MKVLNYITSYLAAILLIIISIWAAIFYYAMLDEIYDSIDDGLDNQKGLILQKVIVDSSILGKSGFDEGDYSITEISAEHAKSVNDIYIDTSMYMQNEQDYEPVRLLRTSFHHNGKYYLMQVVTSMVEEDDLITELLYAIIWLYFGVIITVLVLNNFLLKRTWRPFYHLLRQLKNFRLEKPAIEVTPTRIEEFRLLNEAVQKMVQSNVVSYNSQKHFIENASHELQTPLAISINKLEALAENRKLSREDSILLQSALDNLEKLTRLNRSLLLLYKIENRQFVSVEPVDINALTKRITDDFSDQLEFSRTSVEISELDSCIVQMNPDLANILITNLIKNAIVHNHEGGKIIIEIEKSAFIVSNTGQSSPLDKQLLFQRFHKQGVSRNSTGLGLSIVKAITVLFDFTISYDYNGMHKMKIAFAK